MPATSAYVDHEIGRVIQAVEDMGKLDNTLIIYIGGDNGASPEGTTLGTPNEFASFNSVVVPVKDQLKDYDDWGSDKTFPHYAVGWAWAFDTPFKWTKQVASHFGGTRQGMAMSWPARIKDAGGIRTQFHHVIDIVPTILEASGVETPEKVDGIPQKPIDGVSMVYTWDKANANAPSTRKTQYFEMLGMRGIYHDGWMASHHAARSSVGRLRGSAAEDAQGHPEWLHLGTVQPGRRSHAGRRHRGPEPAEACRDAEDLHGRGEEVQRVAAGQPVARPFPGAATERDRGPDQVHLHRRTQQHAQRRARRPCSTGPSRSPPRWKSRRAARRGCS